ncbi:hypothetical protein DFP72DRAFT_353971 [Ephemerocybe angulata]|uniref:Uncharacterized protein n=2 Tax=Ephemerocybe angulata TaxID=980116 RepID=A0A8H6M6L3_9AGAR|nr:hypothetical protein DFP72DRAFT_353971 [Tulosesus angulatus]
MPPPGDTDSPPGPAPSVQTLTATSQPAAPASKRDNLEVQEKYRKLKKRFFELEEKHKETSTELQRSGERNVRMREEREQLLERIMELEQQGHGSPGSPDSALPHASALPRTLLSARARSSFEENLRKAIEEEEDDEDLVLPSRHTASPPATLRRSTRAAKSRAKRPAEDAPASPSSSTSKRHKSRPSIEADGDEDGGEPSTRTTRSRAGKATDVRMQDVAPPAIDANIDPSLGAPQKEHHPLSGNPYLSLSTIMLPKPGANGAPTPTPSTAHPMFMNPYMYYPSPITPTPNTPSYPYNPYFYLTGPPVLPPPMYPQQNAAPPPTPTSSTQSRPPPAPEQPPRVKPKRLKAHTVTSKSYSIPLVPRDKAGKPMLPLNVGIMTVIALGSVCMREHFHTERYIFPVGYEVTRRYLSTINPSVEVVYHCSEGG